MAQADSQPVAQTKPQSRSRFNLAAKESLAAYLFLLPNIIGFAIFTLIALIWSLALAFTNWDILTPLNSFEAYQKIFVGFDNFTRLLTSDSAFLGALWNTFVYTVTTVPITMLLALVLAIVLNQPLRGRLFFRAAYFMPTIVSTVVIALIWGWLYNPDFGPINYILIQFGIQNPPTWTSSITWSMPSMVIMSIWKSTGYLVVLYLAGLQAVPQHLYEAASIDGAGAWNRFRHITLPLLTPTTFFVLITSLIGSFQAFEQALILTDGGPANSTRTIVLYIYQRAFSFLQMGYGAAMAWILCVIILIITLIQWRLQQRWVHYE